MDVNIKEYSKDELTELLFETGTIVNDYDGSWGLDVPKFLRQDKSLNLELLEFALEAIIREGVDTIFLYQLSTYFELRMVAGDSQREKEETQFLVGFCSSVANELSEHGEVMVYVNDKAIQ